MWPRAAILRHDPGLAASPPVRYKLKVEGTMSWQTHSLTPDRFEDFADVINPNRRTNHCWCLSHRLRAKDIEELGKGDRQQAMRRLSERQNPPGVVTYRRQHQ
jgi:hypothetical protein